MPSTRSQSKEASSDDLRLMLKNVSKRYSMFGPAVLSDISCEIMAGEVIALVGNNGTGKSILMKLISMMEEHSDGEIELRKIGKIVNAIEYLRNVSYVGRDNPYNWSRRLRIQHVLDLHAQASPRWDKGYCEELLNAAELQNAMFCKTLSQGEVVLLQLCVEFTRRPYVILLDEVLSTIDAEKRPIIDREIVNLAKKGSIVIFVSHVQSDVNILGTRVLALDGKGGSLIGI
jgi:ABC-2 type transport system ATP-binding protein